MTTSETLATVSTASASHSRLRGVDERFPGELETLRADNMRLRRLLELSKEQARAADPDQPALTGAPTAPVDMRSAPEAKLRFYTSLFRCRTDVYALRWENSPLCQPGLRHPLPDN